MPSFVIHLAIGKEYIKKNKIENEEEFLKGSIAPDFKNNFKEINKEKEESHFTSVIDGKQVVQLNKFKNKVNTNEDFWKGYLLHILTDFYFYQKYFKEASGLGKRNRICGRYMDLGKDGRQYGENFCDGQSAAGSL